MLGGQRAVPMQKKGPVASSKYKTLRSQALFERQMAHYRTWPIENAGVTDPSNYQRRRF